MLLPKRVLKHWEHTAKNFTHWSVRLQWINCYNVQFMPRQVLSGGRFLGQRNVFFGTDPHILNSIQPVFIWDRTITRCTKQPATKGWHLLGMQNSFITYYSAPIPRSRRRGYLRSFSCCPVFVSEELICSYTGYRQWDYSSVLSCSSRAWILGYPLK